METNIEQATSLLKDGRFNMLEFAIKTDNDKVSVNDVLIYYSKSFPFGFRFFYNQTCDSAVQCIKGLSCWKNNYQFHAHAAGTVKCFGGSVIYLVNQG